jgi:hypothetical protein
VVNLFAFNKLLPIVIFFSWLLFGMAVCINAVARQHKAIVV